jgi:two-component system OmpR family sensor kinase
MASPRKSPSRTGAIRPRVVHSSGKSAPEAALGARIAELEKQVQARDDFLAMAAHELRNPMTPISAQLELLLAKARDSARAAPAELVEGLERLEQLVDAYLRRTTLLLEVSRIRSGNLRLQIAEVNFSGLVREITTGMIPLADRAGCSVRVMVEEGVIARCDAMAMEQVLENLLSNAVRYGPGRPIEVTISSDGPFGRLSVRDEGVGISESDQSQIFERFHTVRRISPNGGFAVGLWVARRLVTAMAGEIAVASAAGAGSTFTVKLPLSTRERNGN